MGQSRGRKVKTNRNEGDVFWMSLEEAKRAISDMGDKYEFLTDRMERRTPKKPA